MDNPKKQKGQMPKQNVPPARMMDKDRLTVLLHGERVRHAMSKVELAKANLALAQSEFAQASTAEQVALTEIRSIYLLGPQDTFHSETGDITRVPVLPPEEAANDGKADDKPNPS